MRPRSTHVLRSAVLALLLAVPAAAVPASAAPPSTSARDGGTASLADGCDPVDPAACLLPFPSDLYTVADPATDTGIRVNLQRSAMPENIFGANVDPTDWNRNDGFSPGSMLLTRIPGLDPVASGIAPSTDIGRSLAPDAPIVLVNTRTGERHPYWAELDANAADAPDRQVLIIRPARNLDENTRYAVGLRSLRDSAGATIPARSCSPRCGRPPHRPTRRCTAAGSTHSGPSARWTPPASTRPACTSPGTSRWPAGAT
ncbi:hypothetical protein [Micromonospora inyonensis]|uniref:hypothetical protein n=1 Tax=Micromonospora inyonensis TaxID=47866 RepID=UPI000B105276|nr:hypothetical protein [Micromonospora inyonensis]